jgi:hypothetical protein
MSLRRKVFGWAPKNDSERVLSSCDSEEIGIECRTLHKGAIELAVFLQHHTDANEPLPADEANVRIACRSWSPAEFNVTRDLECEGGTLAPYDSKKEFKLIAGRVAARRYRSYLVGDGVRVTREPSGAKIGAVLNFVPPDQALSTAAFSLSFPSGGPFKCLCC